MKNKNLSFMTQAAMIAAIYVVLTYIFAPFLSEKYRFVSPRHSLFYQYLHQLLFRDSLPDV